MSDKAVKKVKNQAREMVKRIQSPANVNEEYKAIGAYNAYVSGVHNYYRFATHISKDMRKISLSTTRTMQNRLRERLQKTGESIPAFIAEKYGKSKQLRFVSGQVLIPIGYIQTKAPLYKRREVNQYTVEGRESIHKHLQKVDMSMNVKFPKYDWTSEYYAVKGGAISVLATMGAGMLSSVTPLLICAVLQDYSVLVMIVVSALLTAVSLVLYGRLRRCQLYEV